MPQLDLASFLTQYIWGLMVLFILFSILVFLILPNIKKQLAIRSKPLNPPIKLGIAGEVNTQLNIFKQLFLYKQNT